MCRFGVAGLPIGHFARPEGGRCAPRGDVRPVETALDVGGTDGEGRLLITLAGTVVTHPWWSSVSNLSFPYLSLHYSVQGKQQHSGSAYVSSAVGRAKWASPKLPGSPGGCAGFRLHVASIGDRWWCPGRLGPL